MPKTVAMHGRDHLPFGSDPIPGLLYGSGTGSYQDAVLDTALTAWWRMGDTFTFASTVLDALLDSAVYGGVHRDLRYTEPASTDRPTLHVANPSYTADDGAVLFGSTANSGSTTTPAGYFDDNAEAAIVAVTKIGQTADQCRTWACWIKTGSWTATGDTSLGWPVIGRWGMDASGSFNTGWVVEIVQTLQIRWRMTNSTGTQVQLVAPGLATPNTWYHLAGSYDGTTAILYVNGLVAATQATSIAVAEPSSPYFRVGYAIYDYGVTSVGYSFAGGIVDEVVLYKRVLSGGEIAGIATGGTTRPGNAVESIAATGSPPLTGDVTLSAGTNITLTEIGQNIQIAAAGGSATLQWEDV